nr:putative hydrolase [Quercus suber]
MFPDRVGRVVLDGVLDAEIYSAPASSGSIEDSDAVFDSFFAYCAKAGAPKCAIARKGDNAADIRTRVELDLNTLRQRPIIGVNPVHNTPSIVTWSQFQKAIFTVLYGPVRAFPGLAQLFQYLHTGDEESILLAMPQLHSLIRYEPYCNMQPASSFDSGDARFSILCIDKSRPINATVSRLQTYYEELANTSSFADVYMNVVLGCNGWPIKPVQLPLLWESFSTNAIKTSFPLLFVSNSYDPITPLRSGLKMAQKFDRAGFLEMQGEGHCSLAEISICTISKIRAYFREGTIPPAPRLGNGGNLRDGIWERCETDEWPWQPFTNATDAAARFAAEALDSEDQGEQILEAWKALQDHVGASEDLIGRPSPVFAREFYPKYASGDVPWL